MTSLLVMLAAVCVLCWVTFLVERLDHRARTGSWSWTCERGPGCDCRGRR